MEKSFQKFKTIVNPNPFNIDDKKSLECSPRKKIESVGERKESCEVAGHEKTVGFSEFLKGVRRSFIQVMRRKGLRKENLRSSDSAV
jgi:hypothetical protein